MMLTTNNKIILLLFCSFLVLAVCAKVPQVDAASVHQVSLTLFYPKPISADKGYSMSGKLMDTTANKPLGGKSIDITAPGFVGKTTTDSIGVYHVYGLAAPGVSGLYSIQAKFSGGSLYNTVTTASYLEVTSTTKSAITVSITASQSTKAPASVSFTVMPRGGSGIYSYKWAFGDGAISTVQNPTHTYPVAGTYSVKLTITDSFGTKNLSTISISSILSSKPLVTTITTTHTSGKTPFSAYFWATAKGGATPYSYKWAFGDGATSTVQNPSHIYYKAGTFNVKVTATDVNGKTGSSFTQIITTLGTSVSDLPLKQANLWVNQTNTKGSAWGAIGFTNTGTTGIYLKSISVDGVSVPFGSWYVDKNKAEVTSVNFNTPYIVTSMYNTGFLKDSESLSANVCYPSSNKLRIDFDGLGKNPALCLVKQSSQVLLSSGQSMIIYFKVPIGAIVPSDAGLWKSLKIVTSTDIITQNVKVKNLNNFNLKFWLHTDQAYYWKSLGIFAKYLKSGDYIMIGNGINDQANSALDQANAAKSKFKPGVIALSYRLYFPVADLVKEVPTLPKGYDLIVYDYEIGMNPDFTTDMTKTLSHISAANNAVNLYNTKTGSHAKLMVTISYPPIRWSTTPWDWGTVAGHMNHIDVMMSGYYSSPCLGDCSSSSMSQIRDKSPNTDRMIQLSMASTDRGTPKDISRSLYVVQGVGVNTVLVFYSNDQVGYLQQLFDLLHY